MALSRTSIIAKLTRNMPTLSRVAYSSDSAGAIREAGGSFGEKERAAEETYFRKQQQEQLKKLKEHLDEEIKFHEQQVQNHKDSIAAHEKRIADLKTKQSK